MTTDDELRKATEAVGNLHFASVATGLKVSHEEAAKAVLDAVLPDHDRQLLEHAADALEACPPFTHDQYVKVLRLYAAEPWRMRVTPDRWPAHGASSLVAALATREEPDGTDYWQQYRNDLATPVEPPACLCKWTLGAVGGFRNAGVGGGRRIDPDCPVHGAPQQETSCTTDDELRKAALVFCEAMGWEWEREPDAGIDARSSVELAEEGLRPVLDAVLPDHDRQLQADTLALEAASYRMAADHHPEHKVTYAEVSEALSRKATALARAAALATPKPPQDAAGVNREKDSRDDLAGMSESGAVRDSAAPSNDPSGSRPSLDALATREEPDGTDYWQQYRNDLATPVEPPAQFLHNVDPDGDWNSPEDAAYDGAPQREAPDA